MIRTKGEAGTGNIVEASATSGPSTPSCAASPPCARTSSPSPPRSCGPRSTSSGVAGAGKLPVVNFVAGGSRPGGRGARDAVGRGRRVRGVRHLQERGPGRTANAIVQATTHYDNPKILAEVSKGLGAPMRGIALERFPRASASRCGLVATTPARRTRRSSRVRIGVLALQGAFREHLATLAAIGVVGVEVRLPEDLVDVHGLILPGGESTTMRASSVAGGWPGRSWTSPRRARRSSGTCAGMIVLSRAIAGGEEPILPLLDVIVERNAFGASSTRSRRISTCRSSASARSTPSSSGLRSSTRWARVDVLARLDDAGSWRCGRERARDRVHRSWPGDALPPPRRHDGRRARDPGEGAGRRPHPLRRARIDA